MYEDVCRPGEARAMPNRRIIISLKLQVSGLHMININPLKDDARGLLHSITAKLEATRAGVIGAEVNKGLHRCRTA